MLKWSRFDTSLLNEEAAQEIDSSKKQEGIRKSVLAILGLDVSITVNDLKYYGKIYNKVADTSIALSFDKAPKIQEQILNNTKSLQAKEIFLNQVMRDDLLNLFDDEDAELPTFSMLESFTRNNKADFQEEPTRIQNCWVGEWSSVNGWVFFWTRSDTFNCIAYQNS